MEEDSAPTPAQQIQFIITSLSQKCYINIDPNETTLSNVRSLIKEVWDDDQYPPQFNFRVDGLLISMKQEDEHMAGEIMERGAEVELVPKKSAHVAAAAYHDDNEVEDPPKKKPRHSAPPNLPRPNNNDAHILSKRPPYQGAWDSTTNARKPTKQKYQKSPCDICGFYCRTYCSCNERVCMCPTCFANHKPHDGRVPTAVAPTAGENMEHLLKKRPHFTGNWDDVAEDYTPSDKKYQQSTCDLCRNKLCRTYCSCDLRVCMCADCFANHKPQTGVAGAGGVKGDDDENEGGGVVLVPGHELQKKPRYSGSWDAENNGWKQVKSEYLKEKCKSCGFMMRTYCSCDKSVPMCTTCFGKHCLEVAVDVAAASSGGEQNGEVVPFLEVNENDVEAVGGVTGHELKKKPAFKGPWDPSVNDWADVTDEFPMEKCSVCECQIGTYCSCDRGTPMCSDCFGKHCMTVGAASLGKQEQV